MAKKKTKKAASARLLKRPSAGLLKAGKKKVPVRKKVGKSEKNASFLSDPRVKKLLSAKDPVQYIDFSIKTDLKSGEKMQVTPLWIKKTGYTISDIQHARNRHPYWKAKKMQNAPERNKIRQKQHNYSQGGKVHWTDDELRDFIEINDDMADWKLAERFKRSIPSIQYIRRRISLAQKILLLKGKQKIHKESMLKMIARSEDSLRVEWRSLHKISGNPRKNTKRKT